VPDKPGIAIVGAEPAGWSLCMRRSPKEVAAPALLTAAIGRWHITR
jgi:hypothetical protein